MSDSTPPRPRSPESISFESASGLYGVRWGDGPDVYVGWHGWNGSTATFEPLARHLSDEASLIAFDLPGYGDSPAPTTWSMPAIARLCVDALQERGVERFSMIGNCSGAATGLYVGRETLSRDLDVDTFVLVEPFGYVPWYLKLLILPIVGWAFYRIGFGTAIGRNIANAALSDKRDDSTDLMGAFADSPLHVPYRYLELFDALPAPETFDDVPGDKLLVETEHTFEAVRRSIRQFEATWPDTRRHRLSEAGHLPLEERPAAVAELLF